MEQIREHKLNICISGKKAHINIWYHFEQLIVTVAQKAKT